MALLLIKTCLLCVFAIVVRGTLPRYRIDQLALKNWKLIIYLFVIFYLFLTISIFFFTHF